MIERFKVVLTIVFENADESIAIGARLGDVHASATLIVSHIHVGFISQEDGNTVLSFFGLTRIVKRCLASEVLTGD